MTKAILKKLAVVFAGLIAATTIAGTSTITTNSVSLTKSVPDTAILGANYEVTLTLTATADSAKVVVGDEVPSGASYVSSNPQADVNGSKLTWNVGDMNAGETKTIKLTLKADREGDLTGCCTLTAIPRCCVATFVGKPELKITKTGPEYAFLNDMVTYNVVVTNTGTATAKNVVVTDTLPAGLKHDSGSELKYNVGDLAPKQSAEIPVTVKAAERGRHCNKATAASDNTPSVDAEACTTVQLQALEITKTTSTPEQYLGKNAGYKVTVKNTGDTDLTGVVVTDVAPAETVIRNAGGGSVSGNVITWNVGTLAAGADKSFDVVLTSKIEGRHCNGASVTTNEGLNGSAEACTVWKGYPAVLIEVIDTVDPLLVGESTTYVIRVTNQGTANDTNVGITCRFPAQISPTSAAGSTDATVNGKTVNTKPYPVLKPGEVIEWRVEAKAQSEGDSRLKVDLKTDLLQTPVVEEESTHVY